MGERLMSKTQVDKTYILVAIILGASILGYALINNYYKEKVRQSETEIQYGQEKAEAINLRNCLKRAYQGYEDSWDNECESRGMSDGCSLPASVAKELNDFVYKTRNDCIKLYGTE